MGVALSGCSTLYRCDRWSCEQDALSDQLLPCPWKNRCSSAHREIQWICCRCRHSFSSSCGRSAEDFYAILFLLIETPAPLLVHKHEDDTGLSDGQKAMRELMAKYNKIIDEVIRAKLDEARQL